MQVVIRNPPTIFFFLSVHVPYARCCRIGELKTDWTVLKAPEKSVKYDVIRTTFRPERTGYPGCGGDSGNSATRAVFDSEAESYSRSLTAGTGGS
jgi:hypothetical protein